MTPERKLQNLKVNVSNLCKILNENGFKYKSKDINFSRDKNGNQILSPGTGYSERNWEVDENFPEATFIGGICSKSPEGFNFLKRNGYIDIGVCWSCGEEPIGKNHTFTSGFNSSIEYFICDECYSKNSGQKFSGQKQGSGCMVLIISLAIPSSFLIYFLSNLIF